MIRIGWATSAALKDLIPAERDLLKYLQNDQWIIEPVVWDEQHDWRRFDLVIVRSIWDYHLKVDQYRQWLDELDQSTVTICNNTEIMRWNYHKFYLQELASRDLTIIPTIFHSAGEQVDLEAIFNRGWNEIILKPAISATAHNLFRLNIENYPGQKEEVARLMNSRDFLIQRFQPEVISQGELSIMYFNSSYSHAVLKIPGAGDFRVQKDFGGTARLFEPDKKVIEQADQIANALSWDPLFMRIDGIVVAGQFLLMELELIEPELFFLNDEINNNFKNALLARLGIS